MNKNPESWTRPRGEYRAALQRQRAGHGFCGPFVGCLGKLPPRECLGVHGHGLSRESCHRTFHPAHGTKHTIPHDPWPVYTQPSAPRRRSVLRRAVVSGVRSYGCGVRGVVRFHLFGVFHHAHEVVDSPALLRLHLVLHADSCGRPHSRSSPLERQRRAGDRGRRSSNARKRVGRREWQQQGAAREHAR